MSVSQTKKAMPEAAGFVLLCFVVLVDVPVDVWVFLRLESTLPELT